MAKRCLGCGRIVTNGSRCGGCARARNVRRGEERGGRAFWSEAVKRIRERDGHACVRCGVGCPHLQADVYAGTKCHEVDHIVPLMEGGSNADGNLQLLCSGCHREKTTREGRRG